jgi:EAL domain-containing protein (putative c-di-GMP-specific phosphodiesterase class I)
VEQLEQVRNEGCTEVQGYLFGRPVPEAEVHAILHGRDARALA